MNHKMNSKLFMLSVWAALCLIVLPVSIAGQGTKTADKADKRQGQDSIANIQIAAAFEGRVKEYARLRERLEEKLPKLPKDSTPEQIKAHKTAFEELVRKARAGARQGDIFTPEATTYIRALMREFRGEDRKELRSTALEAETQGVPLRVNYAYPETKELTQMPPTLLLKLPQLPKQVRYRFVGRHMILMDRENDLIIDYMLDALP